MIHNHKINIIVCYKIIIILSSLIIISIIALIYHCNTFPVKFNGAQPSWEHYGDVIMGVMASQITSLTIVYSNVYSGADQSIHQSSASLAFVWGIHRGPVNSPHKWPVTRKMFPFDDVIMNMPFPSLTYRDTNQHRKLSWCQLCCDW